MADGKRGYPIMPSNNWWRIRERFGQSVPSAVTPNYLATILGSSEKTAKNNLPALRTMGLINEDGVPTERANHWRFDDDYPGVCRDIIEEVYPEELRHAIPEPNDDLAGAERWFKRDAAAGDGAARQMARFYALLVDADPAAKPDLNTSKTPRSPKKKDSASTPSAKKEAEAPAKVPTEKVTQVPKAPPVTARGLPEVHIDVQIHISSDSTPEQIDQIFASMKKHLYDGDR